MCTFLSSTQRLERKMSASSAYPVSCSHSSAVRSRTSALFHSRVRAISVLRASGGGGWGRVGAAVSDAPP